MARFTPQPDEGYSEDPLPALSAATSFSLKLRDDAVAALGSVRAREEFPPWLIQHISSLSLSRRTGKSLRGTPRAWPSLAICYPSAHPPAREQSLPWPSLTISLRA